MIYSYSKLKVRHIIVLHICSDHLNKTLETGRLDLYIQTSLQSANSWIFKKETLEVSKVHI